MGNAGVPATERRATSERPESSPGLTPGTRVGRYVVLKMLGRGGMGVVYMAYDEKLDRRVALKLLMTERVAVAAGHSERLLREAQAMAKLSHPNVVPIYDVGTAGEGEAEARVFLAMEYVDGVNLRAWRRASPRSAKAIVEMVAQAGRGLEAAHAAGILHRDLKPENVLVDASGVAHVIDFGLAWIDPTGAPLDELALSTTAIAGDGEGGPPLTRVGAILGTPEYMAPEQFRGDRAEARSDVFAFAVVLWEALSGERPFEGETAQGLLAAIDAERVRGGARLSRALRAVLLRGLRAKPEDRWPTMRAMVGALEGAMVSRKGHVAAAVLGAGVVAALALAVAVPRRGAVCAGADREIAGAWGDAQRGAVRRAFVATSNPRAEDTFTRVAVRLDEYAAAWARMRTESCEATRVRHAQSDEALDLRTACLDQKRSELAATAEVLAKADAKLVDDAVNAVRALSDIGECADVEALRSPYTMPHDPAKRRVVEEMRRGLAEGKALYNAGRNEDAREVVSRVLVRARVSKNRLIEAAALDLAAWIGSRLDERASATAETSFAAAVEADATSDDQTEADAWLSLVGTVGFVMGKYEESEEYARLAGSAIERGGDAADERVLLLRFRASAFLAKGELLQALLLYREALALAAQTKGSRSLEAGLVESDLASMDATLGHGRESVELFRSVAGKMTDAYGPGHPRTWRPRVGEIAAWLFLGEPGTALRLAESLQELATTPEHQRSLAQRVAEARVLSDDVAGGVRAFRAALSAEPPGWWLASRHFTLAEALLRRHQAALALPELDEALGLLAGSETDLDEQLDLRAERALCLARLGRAKEAQREATEALRGEEALVSGKPLDVVYLAFGEASLAAGDARAAVTVLDRGSALADTNDQDPEFHADLHLALARALAATRSDLPRARSLAERAAAEYEAPNVRLPALAKQSRAFAAALPPPKAP